MRRPTSQGGEPSAPVVVSGVPTTTTGAGSVSGDVLEGASPARPVVWWSSLSARAQRHLRFAGILAVGLVLLGMGGAAALSWSTERSLRDEVRVEASVGVSSSSTGARGGRVDYYAVVRNAAPRPARLTDLRVAHSRLRVVGRPRDDGPVAPGEDRYVRLSVSLDCRRGEMARTGGVLQGSVGVVTARGRATRVPVSFQRGDPLTYVADTLCTLDPDLRIAEMSGPVSGDAPTEGSR